MRRDHNAYVGTRTIREFGFSGFRDSIDTFRDEFRAMAGAQRVLRVPVP